MKMSNTDVAIQLAAITGKPITEFFNGTITKISQAKCEKKVEKSTTLDAGEVKSPFTPFTTKKKETRSEEVDEEILEYQKMFEGSKIVNSVIMDGRQMTRKEYLKYTKKMTTEEYFKHPLMYKIYRAEGQTDVSFTIFSDMFKKNDPKVKDEDKK